MAPIFSVCLYTHNRSRLLAQALESICAQTLPAEEFEIVVVDNRCTDDTRLVVEDFANRFPSLSYFYEEQLGSSKARNRGWREASGDMIAFMDDDGRAPPEWLEVAARVVQARSPDLFGGPIYPFYDASRPAWFRDDYGTLSPGGQSRFLVSPVEYLYGSNLFVRRSLLEALGGFDESLGMKGRRIGYGEETVLIREARRLDPDVRIFFEQDLFNYHLVRQEKMRLRWQLRHRFAQGRDGYHVFNDGAHRLAPRHVLGFLALPVVIVIEATLGVLLRDRRAYSYPQNYYFERVFQRVAKLGKLYERLRCVVGFRRADNG
jgi:glycosyltransferase involved in cell wall biosynthesis